MVETIGEESVYTCKQICITRVRWKVCPSVLKRCTRQLRKTGSGKFELSRTPSSGQKVRPYVSSRSTARLWCVTEVKGIAIYTKCRKVRDVVVVRASYVSNGSECKNISSIIQKGRSVTCACVSVSLNGCRGVPG